MYNRASGTDVYGAAITLYLDAVEAHSCVDPLMPNSFFEQNTTVNDKSTAGRFDPKVFVNCVQDKE